MKKKSFAIIGAAGFIAKRHIQAIKNLGHDLILACDKHENVGFLDSFFPNCKFINSERKFFFEVKKKKIDYVVICTPNHLHYTHIINGLKNGAQIICEKPLVIKKIEFRNLIKLKKNIRNKINIILQLRLNKKISHIKKFIKNQKKLNSIHLSYITPRGKWYDGTWKAIKTKSGGIQTNIGIHLFDIVCQLFGKPVKIEKYILSPRKYSGKILFPNDVVMSFMLTINANELPKGYNSYRVLEINNKNFDLSKSFTNLHQESYKQIMLKKGFKIETYKKVFEFLN